MPSAEALIVAPLPPRELPGVTVRAAPGVSTMTQAPGLNAVSAADAANDATYRTTLQRGGLAADALGLLGRALGVLTLIFTPGNTGPERTGELNEPLRSPPPELDPVDIVASPGPGQPPVEQFDPRGAPDLVELPEIVIRPQPGTRSNPLRVPAPDVLPAPLEVPILEPFGVPRAEPLSPGSPSTRPRPTSRPEATPAPGVQADPLNDPFSMPRPQAEPKPNARPAPDPAARPAPRNPLNPLALPFDPLRPFSQPESRPVPRDVTSDLIDFVLRGSPDPSPEPQPEPEADRCNCDSKKKKKKKKKDKKPRSVCWQGTYTQRAKGISYARKKQVPCGIGPVNTSSGTRKRAPKDIGDLVGDVFNLPRR